MGQLTKSAARVGRLVEDGDYTIVSVSDNTLTIGKTPGVTKVPGVAAKRFRFSWDGRGWYRGDRLGLPGRPLSAYLQNSVEAGTGEESPPSYVQRQRVRKSKAAAKTNGGNGNGGNGALAKLKADPRIAILDVQDGALLIDLKEAYRAATGGRTVFGRDADDALSKMAGVVANTPTHDIGFAPSTQFDGETFRLQSRHTSKATATAAARREQNRGLPVRIVRRVKTLAKGRPTEWAVYTGPGAAAAAATPSTSERARNGGQADAVAKAEAESWWRSVDNMVREPISDKRATHAEQLQEMAADMSQAKRERIIRFIERDGPSYGWGRGTNSDQSAIAMLRHPMQESVGRVREIRAKQATATKGKPAGAKKTAQPLRMMSVSALDELPAHSVVEMPRGSKRTMSARKRPDGKWDIHMGPGAPVKANPWLRGVDENVSADRIVYTAEGKGIVVVNGALPSGNNGARPAVSPSRPAPVAPRAAAKPARRPRPAATRTFAGETYTLSGNSHPSKEVATDAAARMRASGYPSRVVGTKGGPYHVYRLQLSDVEAGARKECARLAAKRRQHRETSRASSSRKSSASARTSRRR